MRLKVKRIILFTILVFTISLNAQTQPAQSTSLKIGYVDSEVILAQFPEAIKAKADLDGMVAKWRKDLDSMQTDYQKFIADNQKAAETMKKEELQKIQTKVAEKEQKYQQYNQSKFGQPNGEYYQQQQKLMAPVKKKSLKLLMLFLKKKACSLFLIKPEM